MAVWTKGWTARNEDVRLVAANGIGQLMPPCSAAAVWTRRMLLPCASQQDCHSSWVLLHQGEAC